nr:SCO family protein [Chenggangzhangella methanolivorans]
MAAALVCHQAARAQDGGAPRRSAAELMDVLMWSREPIGGPFALVDQSGRARTDADYRGKHLLVYFGFTTCPDICPTDLYQISRALELLGDDAEKVQPLFITLDPERDGLSRLAEYVAAYHPRLVGLTGEPDAIRKTADAYRLFYEKVASPGGGYTVDHSAFIYLMDPSGRYLGFFPPGTTAERMLTILKPHLAR